MRIARNKCIVDQNFDFLLREITMDARMAKVKIIIYI